MNIKYFLAAIFTSLFLFENVSSQTKTMSVHKKDGSIIQFNVSDIDYIAFSTNDDTPYTPTFRQTNMTAGYWKGFAKYGNRIFASNTLHGVAEYKDGAWVGAPGVLEGSVNYPIVRAIGNKLFITSISGVVYQSGDDTYQWVTIPVTPDFSGALGGSESNFFVGAGTNGNGIYRWNGQYFDYTNKKEGCWYSIEALDENTVFFGAGISHVSPNYGIMRWDNNLQEVVETNLKSGAYSLAPFNNKMYATGDNSIYIWNGSLFDKIHDGGGRLKVTGGNLYCINENNILKLNTSNNLFEIFYSSSDYFEEIEEYDGFIYLFGGKIMAYNKSAGTWNSVDADFTGINASIASEHGLFISGMTTGFGIQIMKPVR